MRALLYPKIDYSRSNHRQSTAVWKPPIKDSCKHPNVVKEEIEMEKTKWTEKTY